MKIKVKNIWGLIFLSISVIGTLYNIFERNGIYILKGILMTLYAIASLFYDTKKANKLTDAVVYMGMVFLILFYFVF